MNNPLSDFLQQYLLTPVRSFLQGYGEEFVQPPYALQFFPLYAVEEGDSLESADHEIHTIDWKDSGIYTDKFWSE